MKSLSLIATGTLLAVSCLAADSSTTNTPNTLAEITTQAQKVQKDAEQMSLQLKSRQVDKQLLEQRTAAVEETVARLKQLVADYEATSPVLTASQKLHWDAMKMKVDLLAVFANNKKDALERGDIQKNRSYLRAHADGIAKRAILLQQTANKLM